MVNPAYTPIPISHAIPILPLLPHPTPAKVVVPDCLYELHPEWEKEFRKVPGGAHEELLMIVTAIRQDTVNQLDPDNDDYYDDDFIDTLAWAYYEPELLPLFRNMDDVLLEEILEKIKETQLNNSPQLVAQKPSARLAA